MYTLFLINITITNNDVFKVQGNYIIFYLMVTPHYIFIVIKFLENGIKVFFKAICKNKNTFLKIEVFKLHFSRYLLFFIWTLVFVIDPDVG